jgi:hypothetical protein
MIAELARRLRATPASRPPLAWAFAFHGPDLVLKDDSGLSLQLPSPILEAWKVADEADNGERELLRSLDPATDPPALPAPAHGATGAASRRGLRARLLADAPAWPARLLGQDGWGSPAERWQLVARLLEAEWKLTAAAAEQGDWEARWDQALLARARFLVLSEPFRDPTEPGLEELADWSLGGRDALARRAQQARELWAADLGAFEDRPALAPWSAVRIEEEFQDLIFCMRPAGRRRGPLDLRPPGREAPQTTAWQQAFTRQVVREFFLPRFMLWDAWRALDGITARHPAAKPAPLAAVVRRGALLASPLLLAAAAILLGILAGIGLLDPPGALEWGARAAVLAYLVGVAAILAVGPETGDLACLRLPAGAAVGLLALLSFGGQVAARPPPWTVPALAAAAAFGYLIVEARNHGAPRGWLAIGRAGLVMVLGLLHASAVAAIVLQWLAPALVANWSLAASSWSALARVVLAAATIALALGIFLQVLWQDTPVTAPLSHLHWRGPR